MHVIHLVLRVSVTTGGRQTLSSCSIQILLKAQGRIGAGEQGPVLSPHADDPLVQPVRIT